MDTMLARWIVIIEPLATELTALQYQQQQDQRPMQAKPRRDEARQDETRQGKTDTRRWVRSKRPQGNTKWPEEVEKEEQELLFDLAPHRRRGKEGGGGHSLKPSHASLTPSSLTNGLKGREAISQYNCHATFCILSCLQKSKSHITS